MLYTMIQKENICFVLQVSRRLQKRPLSRHTSLESIPFCLDLSLCRAWNTHNGFSYIVDVIGELLGL